jgi:hypothetical protein
VRSARTSGYAPLEEERGTSWVSVVLVHDQATSWEMERCS